MGPASPPGRRRLSSRTAVTRSNALSADPLSLVRFTRRVHRIHRVPRYGPDPLRWLDAALDVYRAAAMDVLLPTQEQVAVLSAGHDLVHAAGVRTIVPPFAALAQVQDKVSAFGTLTAAGLPQPEGAVLATAGQVAAWDRFPVFLKLPIGTAASGVRRVTGPGQLPEVIAGAHAAGAFGAGGVLAQLPAAGPLVMTQSVFDHGELAAWHANLRVREGAGGGACHKRSLALGEAREQVAALGRRLGWHGALSADAILTSTGPRYIDLNPRLVEPANARRSGVDLVTPLLELACGWAPAAAAARPGRGAHPSAAAGRARRGAAHRAAARGAGRGAGRRAAHRGLPGQRRGTDPAPRRPAVRDAAGPGADRPDDPAVGLAQVRRRQRPPLLAHPGGLARAAGSAAAALTGPGRAHVPARDQPGQQDGRRPLQPRRKVHTGVGQFRVGSVKLGQGLRWVGNLPQGARPAWPWH